MAHYDELMASRPARTDGSMRHVIGWVSTASIESRQLVDVGGWGGSVAEGDGWREFIAEIGEPFVPHYEALRRAIIARGLRRGGDWHQRAPDGVPVFDDGAIGTFSFRAWGDVMAATWATQDGRAYGYMDFYMDACLADKGITPSPPLSE